MPSDNYLDEMNDEDFPSDETMFANAINSSQHMLEDFNSSIERENLVEFEKSVCVVEFTIQS